MTLKEQYEADRDLLLSTELPQGYTVTYNGVSASASFTVEKEDLSNGRCESASLHISNVDVPSWNYRDVVVVDGQTWHVKTELWNDGYSRMLVLYRAENPIWPR